MSIAPVTGIKVPVSFMGKAETKENKKKEIDPSEAIDKFNKEGEEVAASLKKTGAVVNDVTGAAAGVATPIVAAKAMAGKWLTDLFKTAEKDVNGNKKIDFSATPRELVETAMEDGKEVKKLKDGLSKDELSKVVYKMKNSKVKIGAAIAAVVLAVGAVVVKGIMDKKAEAAEETEEVEEETEVAPEEAEVDETAEAEETEETEEA